MSLCNYAENMLLDSFRNVAADVVACFVKLHIGDPGEDGTANPAVETTRQGPISWDVAAGGIMASDVLLTWVDVAATEEYSFVSIWDDVDDGQGNPLWVGELAVHKSMNAGDTFTLAAGDVSIAID